MTFTKKDHHPMPPINKAVFVLCILVMIYIIGNKWMYG